MLLNVATVSIVFLMVKYSDIKFKSLWISSRTHKFSSIYEYSENVPAKLKQRILKSIYLLLPFFLHPKVKLKDARIVFQDKTPYFVKKYSYVEYCHVSSV